MSPEWNPPLPSFYEQEDALMEDWEQMLNYDEWKPPMRITRVRIGTKESLGKAKRNPEYNRAESLMEQVSTIICNLVYIYNTLVDVKSRMEIQRNMNISHISSINT